MEKKLDEYRSRKRKEAFLTSAKQAFLRMFPGSSASSPCSSPSPPCSPSKLNRAKEKDYNADSSDDATHHLLGCDEDNSLIVEEEEDDGCASPPWISITLYALYTLLWATLMGIAVQLEFGAVFFILSLLVIIWLNTSTRRKKSGEPSAYSVFNPNCESIDGALKAEQFEAELRYGTLLH